MLSSLSLSSSDHFTRQFANRRNPKEFSCHCLRLSVAPKGSSMVHKCTRGAQCAQWYPNGTHRDPRGAQGDPSGAQWDSCGGQWDPTCAERDRRTARLEGKGQGSGLVPGRRVGQGRAQWLGLGRGAGAVLAAGITQNQLKYIDYLMFCWISQTLDNPQSMC